MVASLSAEPILFTAIQDGCLSSPHAELAGTVRTDLAKCRAGHAHSSGAQGYALVQGSA